MPRQFLTNDLKIAAKASTATVAAIWATVEILDYFKVLDVSNYGLLGPVLILLVSVLLGTTFAGVRAYGRKTTIVFSVFDKLLPYLPLFLAIEAGYFRRRGIEVHIVCAHGDIETWNCVEEGKADFGLSDPVVMLNENAKGARLIATIVNKAALWGITQKHLPYFHAISQIPKHLTFSGYEEPTTTYRALIHFQNTCGATIKCFRSGEEEAATRDPNVDVVLLQEPFASEWIEKHKGYARVLDGPTVFEDLAWSGVYCTKEYLDNHADIALRVVAALQEALLHIRGNPLHAQQIALDVFHGCDSTAICTATLRMIKQSVFPSELITSRTEWTQALHFWGLSDKHFMFEHYVDNRFAHAASEGERSGT